MSLSAENVALQGRPTFTKETDIVLSHYNECHFNNFSSLTNIIWIVKNNSTILFHYKNNSITPFHYKNIYNKEFFSTAKLTSTLT